MSAATGNLAKRTWPRACWWMAAATPLTLGPCWCLMSWLAGRDGRVVGNLSGFLLVQLLVVATITDIRWHRIPNWATYTTATWSLALVVCAACVQACGLFPDGGQGVTRYLVLVSPASALAGFAVGFVGMGLVYHLSGSGAGDVKLAAALGLLVGPLLVFHILLICHILAGLWAWAAFSCRVGVIATLRILMRSVGGVLFPQWVAPLSREERAELQQPIPMAAFFSLATLAAVHGVFP